QQQVGLGVGDGQGHRRSQRRRRRHAVRREHHDELLALRNFHGDPMTRQAIQPMNAKTGSKRFLTAVAVLSFASLTALGSARAADDPFADKASPPPGAAMAPVPQATDGAGEPGPQKQGPPAAPVEPAPAPTAFVQQLPASAYPEPDRGLYGGSLWLD